MALPTVSFLFTAYQHAAFVGDAVRCALAQDYQPLEIILSDDASNDGTFDIIEQVASEYEGAHTVVVNRNDENLGEPEHVNKLLGLARGDILVIGHGDDLAMPQRTRRLVESLVAQDVSLVSSNARVIDGSASPLGLLSSIATSREVGLDLMLAGGWNSMMLGASFAFDRAVHDRFPAATHRNLPLGGWDHVWPFRAALLKGMYYVAEPLLHYRQHSQSLTTRIADNTSGKLALLETIAAHDINAMTHRLRDLLHFRHEVSDSDQLTVVQQKLQYQMLRATMRWTRLRNRMIVDGLRPTWVDKDVLDAKPVMDDFKLKPEVPEAASAQQPDGIGHVPEV